MSENRKLLNALISFVLVWILFFGGMFVIEFWSGPEGKYYPSSANKTTLGSEIGSVLFMLFIFFQVLYFIFKYLIADSTKFKLRVKVKNYFKRNKQ